ncbi:hypothetical protein [Paraburkholderia hospita]|uniref:hypothetical protein n=1 Tax=Paraburkholderia hospita TaxID=169430 RepID=UPI001FC85FDB|nr:hypothetical protein [Paraburkholderia hospita]
MLAVAYAVANPVFHHVWFALTGTTENFFESLFGMFVGDLTGTLIFLYAMKGLLSVLPKQPGDSRFKNGMFSIYAGLNSAYNNQASR